MGTTERPVLYHRAASPITWPTGPIASSGPLVGAAAALAVGSILVVLVAPSRFEVVAELAGSGATRIVFQVG
jgi:hypothetical protein